MVTGEDLEITVLDGWTCGAVAIGLDEISVPKLLTVSDGSPANSVSLVDFPVFKAPPFLTAARTCLLLPAAEELATDSGTDEILLLLLGTDAGVPLATGAIPAVDTGAIPPLDTGVIPPMDTGAIPPLATGAIPPLDTGVIPPMETGAIPPLDTGVIPPMDTGAIPPLDTGAIPLVAGAGPPLDSPSFPALASVLAGNVLPTTSLSNLVAPTPVLRGCVLQIGDPPGPIPVLVVVDMSVTVVVLALGTDEAPLLAEAWDELTAPRCTPDDWAARPCRPEGNGEPVGKPTTELTMSGALLCTVDEVGENLNNGLECLDMSSCLTAANDVCNGTFGSRPPDSTACCDDSF